MKKFIILLLTIILIQPSSFAVGMKNTMGKVMDSWIGENIDTVINHWGYPSSEKEIAGKKLYYWLNSSYVVSGNLSGVYGGEATCNRILEVDKNNTVVKWQWEGNNCPSTYIFSGKNLVNPNNNPWKKKSEL